MIMILGEQYDPYLGFAWDQEEEPDYYNPEDDIDSYDENYYDDEE